MTAPRLAALDSGAAGAVQENIVFRKVFLRVIPVLMMMYVMAYIDRSNVGFGKLGFTHDLGMSEAMFGAGAGIFFAGYMLFEIPSNLLLSRIGARKTFVRIMVLWALCSAGLAAMTGPKTFLVWRFLLGASEAGLFPGILFYITYWIPESRRARFTAIFLMGVPIAGMIGSPISGYLMHSMDGSLGFHGWQWLFLVEGTPALLIAVAVKWTLCDTPASAPWLAPSEVAVIERALEFDRRVPKSGEHTSLKEMLKSPRFYLFTGMGVALLASSSNVSFWLPTIIHRTGVTDAWKIGLMSSGPFIVGFICQYLVAKRSDAKNERRWHAAVAAAASALGWSALSFTTSSPGLSLVALSVTAAGTFAAMGPFWAMPGQYFSKNAAAGGIALISTLSGIGSLISPIIIGWLNQTTKTLMAGQIYLAVLLMVGSVTVLAIRPQGRG